MIVNILIKIKSSVFDLGELLEMVVEENDEVVVEEVEVELDVV